MVRRYFGPQAQPKRILVDRRRCRCSRLTSVVARAAEPRRAKTHVARFPFQRESMLGKRGIGRVTARGGHSWQAAVGNRDRERGGGLTAEVETTWLASHVVSCGSWRAQGCYCRLHRLRACLPTPPLSCQ